MYTRHGPVLGRWTPGPTGSERLSVEGVRSVPHSIPYGRSLFLFFSLTNQPTRSVELIDAATHRQGTSSGLTAARSVRSFLRSPLASVTARLFLCRRVVRPVQNQGARRPAQRPRGCSLLG